MSLRNILIIEDHMDIARVLEMHLRDLHCHVTTASDGRQGLALAGREIFDLIILDLMLPGIDGLEICRQIRTQPHYTPVLMLTSKSSELDRVVGLEIGADDYVTKPFSIRELMARVKAQFRRVDATTQTGIADVPVVEHGGLCIDTERRHVEVNKCNIDLTAKEYDLLLRFMQNPGKVYSRAQLLDMIWGYGHEGYEHTVNSHINRLRAKIEADAAQPRYILTVWGVGYKFSDTLQQIAC